MDIRRLIRIVEGVVPLTPPSSYGMLREFQRLEAMLLEDRVEFFRKNFVPRIAKLLPAYEIPRNALPDWWVSDQMAAEERTERRAEWLMQQVIAADPDRTRKHAQWLLNLLVKNLLPWEELERATDLLTKFIEKKKDGTVPRSFDLMRLKSLGDLSVLLRTQENAVVQASQDEEQQALSQSEVLLNNAAWLVLIPKTQEAASFFGRDTEWCTAWGCPKGRYPTRTSQFDTYNKSGPLFIAIDKASNTRWQFSPSTGQFMDSDDRPIYIKQWLEANPEPAAALAGYYTRSFKDVTDKFKDLIDLGLFMLGGRERQEDMRVLLGRDRSLAIRTDQSFLAKSVFNLTANPDGTIATASGRVNGVFAPMLNRLGYKGNHPHLQDNDIWWHPDKGYGSFAKVADTIFEVDDWKWVGFDEGLPTRVSLTTNGQAIFDAKITEDGVFSITKIDAQALRAARKPYANAIAAFLMADQRITSWPHQDFYNGPSINLDNLPKELLAPLVEKKPDMANVSVLYKIEGPSEKVRKAIEQVLAEHELEAPQWVEVPKERTALAGGKVVETQVFMLAAEEDDIHAAGKAWGDDDMRRFTKTVEDGFMDWDFDGDYGGGHDTEDYLRALKKADEKTFRKVGVAIWDELDDDAKIEVLDSVGDTYDPSNFRHVEAALDTGVEIDWLKTAIRFSNMDGERAGAEDEAIKAFKSAFDDANIYFKTDDGWSPEFKWDTPVALLVPIEKVVEDVTRGYFEEDYREGAITYHEPQYGFQGFDEDAAVEAFVSHHIFDQMPDVDENAEIEYPDRDDEDAEDEDEDEDEDDDLR